MLGSRLNMDWERKTRQKVVFLNPYSTECLIIQFHTLPMCVSLAPFEAFGERLSFCSDRNRPKLRQVANHQALGWTGVWLFLWGIIGITTSQLPKLKCHGRHCLIWYSHIIIFTEMMQNAQKTIQTKWAEHLSKNFTIYGVICAKFERLSLTEERIWFLTAVGCLLPMLSRKRSLKAMARLIGSLLAWVQHVPWNR